MLVNGQTVESIWLGGERFDSSKIGKPISYNQSGYVNYNGNGSVQLYTAPAESGGSQTSNALNNRDKITITNKQFDQDGSLWYQLDSSNNYYWIQSKYVIIIDENIIIDVKGITEYQGSGNIILRDSPSYSGNTSQYVSSGSIVDIDAKTYDTDGYLWYRLANYGDSWVPEQYVLLLGQINYFKAYTVPASISYSGRGGVMCWDMPFPPQQGTGTYLKNGTALKLTAEYTGSKGDMWYQIEYDGKNQWLMATYVAFS